MISQKKKNNLFKTSANINRGRETRGEGRREGCVLKSWVPSENIHSDSENELTEGQRGVLNIKR